MSQFWSSADMCTDKWNPDLNKFNDPGKYEKARQPENIAFVPFLDASLAEKILKYRSVPTIIYSQSTGSGGSRSSASSSSGSSGSYQIRRAKTIKRMDSIGMNWMDFFEK